MNRKKIIIILSSVSAVLIALFVACFIYLGTYYKGDEKAIEAFSYSGFTEIQIEDGAIAYTPKAPKVGIIFYPGGKVEYTAYVPLMEALASKGVLCILTKMPFNLAVFDIDKAEGLTDGFMGVESWYMAGHSLGGSMACSYISENTDKFDGVILLASYSTEDLSKTELRVLSLYGSNDEVLNMEKYSENKSNLPKSSTEYIIDGGNHAYFGTYGEQKGDGEATVTNKEQIEITVEQILLFVK